MRDVRIVDGEVVTADGYGTPAPVHRCACDETAPCTLHAGEWWRHRAEANQEKAAAYDRINTPEIDDFLSAVRNEALHQRERWGIDADGGKSDADWFWLVGYLAGKALHDVKGKRLHHLITTGAALLNWHAHAIGAYARMRPGIEPPPSGGTPT